MSLQVTMINWQLLVYFVSMATVSLLFFIVYPFMSATPEEIAVVDAASSNDFVERLARTLAKIDQSEFAENPERFRLLARAAMTELQKSTPDMISAAYEAVRFDEGWADAISKGCQSHD